MFNVKPDLVCRLMIAFATHSTRGLTPSIGLHVARGHVVVGASRWSENFPETNHTEELVLARQAFDSLANRGRTWRRLGHVVDLAIGSNPVDNLSKPLRTAADIGCDHGLLAVALILSGTRFDKVIGVDSSRCALEDGAIRMQEKVLDYVEENWSSKEKDYTTAILGHNLEFRLGQGLSVLNPGEGDMVCIAGMGCNTILKILGRASDDGILDLDRIDCRKIVVQPTNSRPRNLMKLYGMLEANGWRLSDEKIEKLSSRWYVTSAFVKLDPVEAHRANSFQDGFVGSKLSQMDSRNSMKRTFDEYVEHHVAWIQSDARKSDGIARSDDETWLQHFTRK